jgi:hypothetical protein
MLIYLDIFATSSPKSNPVSSLPKMGNDDVEEKLPHPINDG